MYPGSCKISRDGTPLKPGFDHLGAKPSFFLPPLTIRYGDGRAIRIAQHDIIVLFTGGFRKPFLQMELEILLEPATFAWIPCADGIADGGVGLLLEVLLAEQSRIELCVTPDTAMNEVLMLAGKRIDH